MTDALAIETVDLQKRYDATEALGGLNLRVPRGSIFGFLGRNGAGKTTTIKLLLGMARPTAGRALVLGLSAEDAALEDLRARYRRVQFVFNGEAPDITFRAPGVVGIRREGRV